MCVVILAWQHHPDFPLVLIANREEFYRREALPAHKWDGDGAIIAGRDLGRGGTWLGVTEEGRFAVVTNYRDGPEQQAHPLSRGSLTTNFLRSRTSAPDFLSDLPGEQYAGYNLIVGHVKTGLWWASNRSDTSAQQLPIEPGIHGLANHLLDTPWPKVRDGKKAMESLLKQQQRLDETSLVEGLFEILANRDKPADEELPSTGIDLNLERELSSMFVKMEGYGTRASSVVLLHKSGQVTFIERSFGPDSKLTGEVKHCFRL